MKTIMIKGILLSSFLLFAVVVLMTVIGGLSSACGAQDAFFCGAFCTLGKTLLCISAITITIYFFRAFNSN